MGCFCPAPAWVVVSGPKASPSAGTAGRKWHGGAAPSQFSTYAATAFEKRVFEWSEKRLDTMPIANRLIRESGVLDGHQILARNPTSHCRICWVQQRPLVFSIVPWIAKHGHLRSSDDLHRVYLNHGICLAESPANPSPPASCKRLCDPANQADGELRWEDHCPEQPYGGMSRPGTTPNATEHSGVV